MSKYEIFNHLANALLEVGRGSGFKVMDGPNKVLVSGIKSPMFNYITFGELNDNFIQEFINSNTLFLCWPQSNCEEEFHAFCEKHNIVKVGESTAHEFTNLNSFEYRTNKQIQMKQVGSEEELSHFDRISSIAFEHNENMAFDFLKGIMHNKNMPMFLAYYKEKPVGCCMLTLVNGVAVLCWDSVLTEYRGLGIGTEMTKFRMNYAKQKGFKSIFAQNLASSISYYQKIGFNPVGSPMPLYAYAGKEAA